MIVISSCVGTIEDTGDPNTEAEGGTVKPAKYAGIKGVKPISDSRVEIYFEQAPGNQSNFIYEIYKDKSKVPIEVRRDALRLNSTGQLSYTYQGLEPSTTYAFSVEFYDLSKSVRSRSSNPALNATTLSNQMCDFDGIIDARNANGLAALSTVNVYWFPAKDSGFVVSSEDYDPVRYEIIAIADSDGGISRINDPTADRKIVTVSAGTSYTAVSGLDAGENYSFQVRCMHTGWKNKGYLGFTETTIGTYSREANNRFIQIETKSAGNTPEFDGIVEVLNPLNAVDADSKLSVQWEPASGGFSEYRVFWYKDEPGPETEGAGSGVYDEASMLATDHLTEAFLDEMVGDPNNWTGCLNSIPATCGHTTVVAEDISTTLSNLDKYGFYQIKVAACVDSDCLAANRIVSPMYLKRVIPNLIPFNGIVTIEDPNPVNDATLIKLQFAPPIKSAGYASRMVVKCYQGVDDVNPDEFTDDSDGSNPGTALPAGKDECEGLALQTDLPAWTDMDDLEEIEIVGVVVNSNRNYCFSVFPEIDESHSGLNYVRSGEENAIIQCISPKIKGPTVQEFEGRRVDVCEYNAAANELTVRWFDPDGGFWTDYEIFWKEFDPESDNPDISSPLNFQKGIDGDADYSSGTAAGNLKLYTIPSAGLIPGKKYHIGVLPRFTLNGEEQYGEFNTNTRECEIPLPQVEFNEWTNIVAIGPKVDGRIPSGVDGFTGQWKTHRIFETLDEYGVPLEVELETGTNDPVDDDIKGNNKIFNGVFGKKDSNNGYSEGPHLYSNSGIIQIEFKDINIDANGPDPSFYDGMDSFHLLREYFITNFAEYDRDDEDYDDGSLAPNATNKLSRKIGYKIFRSDDNKMTWIDLTKNSNRNPFQRTNNEGLIYSKPVMSFQKNGKGRVIGERRVRFTDYSVRHIEDDGGIVNRGRVYWYKVVPYIDGRELEYNDGQHSILRVVLPPPNMSFVSRLMANRQACIELGRGDQIRKGTGQFYSCEYNGIGARGFTRPWNINAGSTFFDLGGDLLVDRFELGCNWTRGDQTEGSPDSSVDDAILGDNSSLRNVYRDFTEEGGLNGTAEIKGCFQVGAQEYNRAQQYNNSEPTNMRPHNDGGATELVNGTPVEISSQLTYKHAIPGDCFGEGSRTIFSGTASRCNDILSDPTVQSAARGYTFTYPGAFENTDYFLAAGACQSAMTSENHNAHPSLGYDNTALTYPADSVTNTDPFAAHSEYAAVFYMREQVRPDISGSSGIRTLSRYFANNTADNGENRYLWTGGHYNPSSCYINLYGVNNESNGVVDGVPGDLTNVRPRWLSLSELLRSNNQIREVARGADNSVTHGAQVGANLGRLHDDKLSEILANNQLYGGDWDPPSRIAGVTDGRINNDMTIGRIMTSNSSKLPPIEGLGQDEFQELCSLYSVEIGYLQDDNFVRDYPAFGQDPLKKRLPRRTEFVAFSAWPDAYDQTTIITLESGEFDDTRNLILDALDDPESTITGTSIDPDSPNADADIAAVESDFLSRMEEWDGRGCNTLAKYNDSSHNLDNYYNADFSEAGVNRFRLLHPTFPWSDQTTPDPLLWSGSSTLDDSIYNTERCVSRYGIQDSAGNYREIGADQFWCDPAAHEFTIENPDGAVDLIAENFPYFKGDEFPNWEDQREYKGEPFGECSVRAPGNDVGGAPTQSGNMVSIYTDFTQQNYNSTLLPNVNSVDPESVLALRNGGDGDFLSFGAVSIVPPLFHSNTPGGDNLTLQTQADSDTLYFSPIIGMPIKCADTSCDTSEDNKLITSSIFHQNLRDANEINGGNSCEDQLPGGAAEDANFKVRDCRFPLGNSDINNHSTDGYGTHYETIYRTSNEGSVNNQYGVVYDGDYIIGIDNGTGDPIYADPIVDSNSDGIIDADDGDAWIDNLPADQLSGADFLSLVHLFPRDTGQAGMFINGGGARAVSDNPGRYALSLTMNSNIGYQKYLYTTRCLVKVYGSDY